MPLGAPEELNNNQLLLETIKPVSVSHISFLDKYVLSGSMGWLINGELYRKLLKVGRRCKVNSNRQKQLYGETYVPYQITKQLRERGIKQNRWTNPMTYRAILQYPKYNDIDLYLRLVDENLNTYRCYINIYNWKKMHNINDFIFKNRILTTFNRIDPEHRNYWIIAMNHRNIPLIADRCQANNILVLPLKEHITIDFLNNITPFENVQYEVI